MLSADWAGAKLADHWKRLAVNKYKYKYIYIFIYLSIYLFIYIYIYVFSVFFGESAFPIYFVHRRTQKTILIFIPLDKQSHQSQGWFLCVFSSLLSASLKIFEDPWELLTFENPRESSRILDCLQKSWRIPAAADLGGSLMRIPEDPRASKDPSGSWGSLSIHQRSVWVAQEIGWVHHVRRCDEEFRRNPSIQPSVWLAAEMRRGIGSGGILTWNQAFGWSRRCDGGISSGGILTWHQASGWPQRCDGGISSGGILEWNQAFV